MFFTASGFTELAARFDRCRPYTCCLQTCNCCPPMPPFPPFPPVPPVVRTFSFQKITNTGAALQGVVFAITTGLLGAPILDVAVSNANGAVTFDVPAPGTYVLYEALAPDGFPLPGVTHTLFVDAMGNAFIDGQPASQFQPVNTPV